MEDGNKYKAKPNAMFRVFVSDETDFYKRWCIFLRPFTHLTDKEVDVIAAFLRIRTRLSKVISDPGVLDKMTMSEDSKLEVMKECKISKQNFYVLMSNLRKHGIIQDDIIDPRLIPNRREDDNGCFRLLVVFEDNGQGNNKTGGP